MVQTNKMIMKKVIKKIELLCPAGDLERLKTAVVFGADAVYCGLPSWSLRNVREINFTIETLKEGIEFAHERGAKVYLTFNVFPHESQIEEIKKILKNIKEILKNIDGVIVSDLGMFSLVKKHLPKIEIHISTQANTLNSEAIKVWGELGAKRVVLARETMLEEIKKIKQKISSPFFASSFAKATDDKKATKGDLNLPIEIEVFGHGAMCMAYSGRCLLSKYFTGREANLGDCAQSCRWKYKVKKSRNQEINLESESQSTCSDLQYVKSKSLDGTEECSNFQNFYLEEETRPGELIEIQEDPNGTYFMNSKEICCLDILDQFIESGIDSLKIEGRAKSIYYLATVTRVYRKAIDAYYAKNQKIKKSKNQDWDKLIKELYDELNKIQHRGYSHGFLLGRHDYEQEYDVAAFRPNVIPVGQIVGARSQQTTAYIVEVKNKFKVDDAIEIITPDKIIKTKILSIETEHGKTLDEILKPQEKVWVKFDLKKVSARDLTLTIPERSILRKKTK